MLKVAVVAAFLLFAETGNAQTQISHKKYARQVRKTEKKLTKIAEAEAPKDKEAEETPDLYWIQEYIATMDPALGRPTPEVLLNVLKQLNSKQVTPRAMPGTSVTGWVERGPDNVGGRTRALAWDPIDATGKKVWAGSVGGGLWYNNDITSVSGTWVQVSSLWSNLAVTAIAFDPNKPGTMYVGTGEGYGSSSSMTRGFGLFKSVDSGKTFAQVASTNNQYYCNDVVVRNESGTSVVYAAFATNYYGAATQGFTGLYRSTNGGTSFTNVSGSAANGGIICYADLEIAADNRLWAGTMRNQYSGTDAGGGRVQYSDNGTTWTTVFTGRDKTGRVEVACAPGSPYTVYAILESGFKLDSVVVSHDRGANWTKKTEPADADLGIPATDFTRGQAWYDFILAVDPNDTNTVIIGGVDLFRSTNSGGAWTQISKWANNANLNTLSCSYAHADQHAIVFKPGSSSTCLIGNDGGVFYCNNLSGASGSSSAIVDRNKSYNVTQFYWGDLAATSGSNNLIAGAQDNGTHKFTSSGINSTTQVNGGDGAYCFISPSSSGKQVASYVYNQYNYTTNNWASANSLISDGTTGKFINPAEWDDNGPGLFSGKGTGTAYRITLNASPGTLQTITWNASATDKVSALAAYKNSSNKTNLYVGTDAGKVYFTSDAWGASPTFSNVTNGMNSGNISGIHALRGGDTVATILSNYGVINIYLSLNAGGSWSGRDGNLPNIPVWAIAINPTNPNEAVIGTDVGIYGTTNFFNASPTWTPYTAGMGAVKVSAIRYRKSDKVLLAVTHGRGLFTSDAWAKNTPIALFGSNQQTACTNQSVTFQDSSLNNPTAWAWSFSPKTFVYTGSTDSTSQNPKVMFTKGGSYNCILKATNTLGTNTKTLNSFITVTDTVPTSAFVKMGRDSICNGDTLLLTVTVPAALSGTISSYAWSQNLTSLSGSTATMIVNPLKNDSFYVHLTSTKLCASPANFKSNVVRPLVKPIINASMKLAYAAGCAGSSLQVTANGTNIGASPSYNWYVNNTLQSGHSNLLTIAAPLNGDKVYAKVFVAGQCVKPANQIYSDTATLVIKPKPTTPGVSRNYDTLFASNVGTGAYIWYKNGTFTGTGRVYRAPQNAKYRCIYSENGCSSDSSAVIVFNSLKADYASKNGISLTPNPVTGKFLINGVTDVQDLKIYQANGAIVQRIAWNLQSGAVSVDATELPAGSYFVELKTKNSGLTLRFVKQ